MNSLEATAPSAAAPTSVPLVRETAAATDTGRFHGNEGTFFGLLVRGAFLLMLTLGIYRFWLTTDVRRFLWGHSEIAGDGLEYTGTARELLIGFLMAIVLLVPINALFFLGTLIPDMLPYAGTLGFVALALLGQFAYFRARRYRLTRTVYRGVRFFQTGSAWNYSIRSNLWSIVILLTFGLAYPWATASLERYKMRHTQFGDLEGGFAGSGTRLFLRGILLWAVVVGPLVVGLIAAVATVNWQALAEAATAPGDDVFTRIETGNPELWHAMVLLLTGLVWSVLAAILLYPVFRAIIARWWLSGLRLGEITAVSRLRNGQMYGVYARFLGFAVLFSIASSIVFAMSAGLFYQLEKSLPKSSTVEIIVVVLLLVGYVVVMLGYSTIYQGTVSIRVWRLAFETTEFTGLEALGSVKAQGEASGAFGEGLADALDVGGM